MYGAARPLDTNSLCAVSIGCGIANEVLKSIVKVERSTFNDYRDIFVSRQCTINNVSLPAFYDSIRYAVSIALGKILTVTVFSHG